ncbi:MAG: hypothetical protein Q9179_002661 [Wetmoreana sp. 5 TL-2023]
MAPKKHRVKKSPKKASAAAPMLRTHVYIVKKLEGWRPTEQPLGKFSCDILGVFQNASSANTFARHWLYQHWPDHYASALEDVDKEGGVSIDMETGNKDGVVLIDVEKYEVDERSAWEFL